MQHSRKGQAGRENYAIVNSGSPVLSQKISIAVERLEYSIAKLEDKRGKMTWMLELEPKEKKVLNYKYSVKYPKYINLSID